MSLLPVRHRIRPLHDRVNPEAPPSPKNTATFSTCTSGRKPGGANGTLRSGEFIMEICEHKVWGRRIGELPWEEGGGIVWRADFVSRLFMGWEGRETGSGLKWAT